MEEIVKIDKKQITKEDLQSSPFYYEKDTAYTEAFMNKTIFSVIHEDYDYVLKKLDELNIKQVYSFNQLGDNFDSWENTNKLALVILPICNSVTSHSKNIELKYMDTFSTTKDTMKNVYPVEFRNNNEGLFNKFIAYFPARNLIVCLINPFDKKEVFDYIINEIKNSNCKYKSTTEIWEERLDTMWKDNIETNRTQKRNQLQTNERIIDDCEEKLKNKWAENILLRKEIDMLVNLNEEMKQNLLKQIEQVKAMSVVKKFYVRDKIYLSFGNISLYGEIEIEDTNGRRIKKREKVELGELIFSISSVEILVTSDKMVENYYPHPHAKKDSICFGAHKAQVAKLLAEMELVKLVSFLYSWAFSYNKADGPYVDLKEFYLLNQENKTEE